MKKLLFVFAIAAVGSLASCKKDYTCTCTDSAGDSYPVEYKGVKKSDAQDACDLLDSASSETSCDLD